MTKSALFSVSDKTGLEEFARSLHRSGYALYASHGTGKFLEEKGLPVIFIESFTGFPNLLDGRVKTLNSKLHAGVLAKADKKEHVKQLEELGVPFFGIVCVNFYPFEESLAKKLAWDELVEFVDIGGPALVRAAAKNHAHVAVLTDPADYPALAEEAAHGSISPAIRLTLAAKAFSLTSYYDSLVALSFREKAGLGLPEKLALGMKRKEACRYGENPHQQGWAYASPGKPFLYGTSLLQGKEMSFNNWLDAQSALLGAKSFQEPACVIVKHTIPCGAAVGKNSQEAFTRAWAGDSKSAFGGVVAFNSPVGRETAEALVPYFIEVVASPEILPEAREALAKKANLRVLELHNWEDKPEGRDLKQVQGGYLVQEADLAIDLQVDCKVASKRQPTPIQWADLLFALCVAKFAKSNAAVIASGLVAVGIGAGQTSRVDAVEQAIRKAGPRAKGAVMASDGFFPFADNVDAAAAAGLSCLIAPSGSIRDREVIEAAEKAGLVLVFAPRRHFRH